MVLRSCRRWIGSADRWSALLLLVVVGLTGAPAALAEDTSMDGAAMPYGPAAQYVRAAAESVKATFARLPPPTQEIIAGQVQILVQTATDAVTRLEQQAVPLVDSALIHDLEYLADVLHSFEVELTNLEQQQGGELDPEVATGLDLLAAAAAGQIVRVDAAADRWLERTQHALVEVEHEDGVIVVRSIDRTAYGLIRYSALALLLLGLLAIGLQWLHMAAYGIDRRELLQGRTVLALTSLGVLGVFFAASLVLAIFPGTVAALSATIEVARAEHPCRALQVQQDQLASAQAMANPYLIGGTKRRMERAAQDCLGLPEDAVAQAVERLAARTGPIEVASRRSPVAEIVAPPPEGVVAAPPAEQPAIEDAAVPLTEEHDVLAELLAEIRTSDAAAEVEEEEPEDQGDDAPPAEGGPATPAPPPEPQLFVTTTVVNYREGPSADAPRLGTLISGARVNVLRQDGGWAEIRLRDGREVYVASEFLEPAS